MWQELREKELRGKNSRGLEENSKNAPPAESAHL
jgi:hypothetical protein